jgi:hypothetical protein
VRDRRFLGLLGLNTLVWFAGYQVFAIVPLHLRGMGASLAGSGRFAAFLTLGTASGALLMGRLGDRVGQARLLRTAGALLVAILASYAALGRPWLFLLLAPLHGLLWAGLKTSTMALATHLLPAEDRASGLSLFGLSGALGVALGPLAGLAALPFLGFRVQILATAAAFLVVAAAPGLPRRLPSEQGSTEGPWPGRAILVPALLVFAWGWGQGLLPPFSAQEARFLRLAWASALLTCFALGMLASRALFSALGRGLKPARLLPWLMAGGLAALGTLALAPGALGRHMAGGALFGASLGLSHTLLFAWAVDLGGPRRGEAVGLMYLAYEAGMGLSAALVGQAMDAAARAWGEGTGFRAGWALGGLLILLALPLALVQARRAGGR